MNVLVACEESQRVCIAFRQKDIEHLAVIFNRAQAVTRNGIYRTMFYLY